MKKTLRKKTIAIVSAIALAASLMTGISFYSNVKADDDMLTVAKDAFVAETVMVKANVDLSQYPDAWVGLYCADEDPEVDWYYNYYSVSAYNNQEVNILDKNWKRYIPDSLNHDKRFKVCLFGDGGYSNVLETKYFTFDSGTLTSDDSFVEGNPIEVTAKSAYTEYAGSWVAIYNYSDEITDPYYGWYSVDSANPTNCRRM